MPKHKTERLLLDVPDHYDLVGLVQAPVVPALPPLVFDAEQRALQVVLYPDARPGSLAVEALVHQIEPGMPLLVAGLPKSDEALLSQLCTVVGIDEDLSVFYALCDEDPGLGWVRGRDAARCLRSPAVFEDLVKCLLFTQAKAPRAPFFAARLCELFGGRTDLSRASFPSAETMAEAPARLYEREFKEGAGRLSVTLRELAERCANGTFYPDSLRRPPRRFSELIADEETLNNIIEEELEWQFRLGRLLRRLPGFSPRACELMLPLLGCYDLLSLDMPTLRAWRQRFSSKKTRRVPLKKDDPGRPRVVRSIVNRVAPYSLYGGLAQRLLLMGM